MKFTSAVLFLFATLMALHCHAVPVTQEQAGKAVRTFLSRNPAPMDAKVGLQPRHVRTFNREGQKTPLFHVVALEGGGFVVTSADTQVWPIIAISEGEDLIESEENHLWILLNKDLEQRMEGGEAWERKASALQQSKQGGSPALSATGRASALRS